MLHESVTSYWYVRELTQIFFTPPSLLRWWLFFCYNQIMQTIVGIDEAGRGPIAGPVAVATLKFKITNYKLRIRNTGITLRDSKKLTKIQRECWFSQIKHWQKEGILDFAVTMISAKEIDRIGINPAIAKALANCLKKLKIKHTEQIVLDGGLKALFIYTNQTTIIKGDEKEPVISCASICAKVLRDKYMTTIGKKYPGYGFDVHKGYGTKAHYLAIDKYGLSPLHRKTYIHQDL